MCGKGSGSPPVPGSTSTAYQSMTAANPNVAPMYQNFLSNAYNLSQTPFNPAMLGQVAPMNPEETQAGTQLFNLGMDMGNFDPAKVQSIESPYTQDVVQATQDWFNNQNQIQGTDLLSQAIRSGNAFGGDRPGIAQAQLAGQQQLAEAPVIAGLRQAGYTQALNEYNQLKQYGMQGAQAALGWGQMEQAQSQRELDVAQQNAMMQAAYPFQIANWYGSTLGGIGPLQGTSALGYTTPPPPSVASQIGAIAGPLAGAVGAFFQKRGGPVGRRRGGFVIPVRKRGGLVPMHLQAGGLSSDVDTGDTAISQLSIPSYAGAPPNAAQWIQQQMRQSRQQPGPSSTSTDIGSLIKSVGGAAIKLAPLLALERGGLVALPYYQDGGDTDDDYSDSQDDNAPDKGGAINLPPVSVAPPAGDQPPPMSPPGTFREAGTPETRLQPGETPPFDPTAGGEGPAAVPMPQPRPAGPAALQPPGGPGPARGGGYGGAGGPSVTTIPGLNVPHRSFLDRWLNNPLTQMGAAMGASRSPYWSVALGQGFQAAGAAAAQQRKEDLLDQQPQMMDVDGKIAFRQGNKIIKTALNSPKGRAAANQQAIADRATQGRILAYTKLHQATLANELNETSPAGIPWSQESPTNQLREADIRAREQWNNENPGYEVKVPERPTAPAEEETAPEGKPGPAGPAGAPPPMTVTTPPPAGGTAVAAQAQPSRVLPPVTEPYDFTKPYKPSPQEYDVSDPEKLVPPPKEVETMGGTIGPDQIARYAEDWLIRGDAALPKTATSPRAKPDQLKLATAIKNYGTALARARGLSMKEIAEQTAGRQYAMRYLLGPNGTAARSIGVAMRHLDTLEDAYKALENKQYPILNSILNSFGLQMGNDPQAAFKALQQIVGAEIIRGVVGTQSGQAERETAASNLNMNWTPGQFEASRRRVEEALAGQLVGQYGQAHDATVSEKQFRNLVGDAQFEKLKAVNERIEAQRRGGGTPATPGGAEHQDVWQDGVHFRWDAQAGKYKKAQ